MTQIIPLTKIGFFNPGRLTDEEIEQSFVARVSFYEFIFKKIISEKPSSIPQHHLIIGQRGMGKTSLLIRIAAELRKTPYKNSFIPLSFPEEQYNVDRLSKFWLNCLDALADALDKEHQTEMLKGLDAEIGSLSKEKALDTNAVYQTFEKWISKTNRRPVLLVDNLNLILSKINKEEQHQLRAILISEEAPILIGASATAIEETVDYGAPFYDAFQINYLKKLSFQESLDILLNLAKITGTPDFSNHLYSKKGRVEALYQLTGGTPRTLAILFPLIQNGFSEVIQTDLDALLDVVTPLYKARFEELSPQLQVVLDAVALHWDPTNIDRLRQITLLENAQLSPQLKRLVDVGWLQKLNAYEAKGGAYELSERFFNIWYLMRRSSRRQKRELYCLTKFLETFYGEDLDEIALSRINYKTTTANGIALDLALADALKANGLSERLRSKSFETLMDLSFDSDEILKNFPLPKSVSQKKINDLLQQVKNHLKNNNYINTESTLQRIIKIDEKQKYAWLRLGNLYMDNLGKYEAAELAYKKAIEIDEKYKYAWCFLGNLYAKKLNKYETAELSYKKAIEIDEEYKYAWNNLGNFYADKVSRHQEAEDAFKKSIEIDEKFAYTWSSLGKLYKNHLGKYIEAEQAFKKAIEIDDKYIYAWNLLGNLYANNFKKYSEAEQAYRKAIEIDDKYIYNWIDLYSLYSKYLCKYQEAEKFLKKAIEIDDKCKEAWFFLGYLYKNHLGKYQEAEQAYKKVTKLDENDSSTWNTLGNLYHDFLHNYIEAEKSYLISLNIDESKDSAKYNLVSLWRDKMNKLTESKGLFNTIIQSDKVKDSYLLTEALFAYYEKNIGIAEGFLKDALIAIGNKLPSLTADDWYRSAAVIVKLGFADSLLKIFSKNGYDTIFRPFYVAIEAATKKDELYFNSIAAEVREPAKKIMERIVAYMK